jgi:hypothetical protein
MSMIHTLLIQRTTDVHSSPEARLSVLMSDGISVAQLPLNEGGFSFFNSYGGNVGRMWSTFLRLERWFSLAGTIA